MTAIPVFGGPSKRDLIQLAYEECGQTGEFELEPEEYQSAERRLDDLMAELLSIHGVDLGYNFPDTGVSDDATEESGIPAEATRSVVCLLADSIAPSIGKQIVGNKVRAGAMSLLISQYQRQPVMGFGRGTPVGSGNRRSVWRTFFPVHCEPR